MSAATEPRGDEWWTSGGRSGVLVLHGFTGTPATVRPVAEALAGAGHTVVAPLLPGHGTCIEDMIPTRYADWLATAEAAYCRLAGGCGSVAIVGLSMGATLTCELAARHPEVSGIVCINPLVRPVEPELMELVDLMLDAGETVSEGAGADLADPDASEVAYEGSPLAAARSLYEALEHLQVDLTRIRCPILLLTSAHDHVVHPDNSDHLAALAGGPVERVTLERSYHVATLDHDREEVARRTVDFVDRVTERSE
ncbi:MAG TPA: alpha/beta fold hydrolase [Acidimicrobiales bacterium]|nr:alpha/beta fold hydrolase [Acidimicrobiales bacterium]